jgi:hypothetical protein
VRGPPPRRRGGSGAASVCRTGQRRRSRQLRGSLFDIGLVRRRRRDAVIHRDRKNLAAGDVARPMDAAVDAVLANRHAPVAQRRRLGGCGVAEHERQQPAQPRMAAGIARPELVVLAVDDLGVARRAAVGGERPRAHVLVLRGVHRRHEIGERPRQQRHRRRCGLTRQLDPHRTRQRSHELRIRRIELRLRGLPARRVDAHGAAGIGRAVGNIARRIRGRRRRQQLEDVDRRLADKIARRHRRRSAGSQLGRRWRLYWQDARSRAEEFFELNLAAPWACPARSATRRPRARPRPAPVPAVLRPRCLSAARLGQRPAAPCTPTR